MTSTPERESPQSVGVQTALLVGTRPRDLASSKRGDYGSLSNCPGKSADGIISPFHSYHAVLPEGKD